MNDHLFLYVATGISYINESVASCLYSREIFPSARFLLITDKKSLASCDSSCLLVFDEVLFLNTPSYSYRDKIEGIFLALNKFSSFIYLDTDAILINSFQFQLPSNIDCAAVLAPVRIPQGWSDTDLPSFFPEYNTGFLYFRSSTLVKQLIHSWLVAYDRAFSLFNQVWDQASFRSVLWSFIQSKNLCFLPFPAEFNLRLTKPWVAGKGSLVYIVHGRIKLTELPILKTYLDSNINRFRTWAEWQSLHPNTSLQLKIPKDPFL